MFSVPIGQLRRGLKIDSGIHNRKVIFEQDKINFTVEVGGERLIVLGLRGETRGC